MWITCFSPLLLAVFVLLFPLALAAVPQSNVLVGQTYDLKSKNNSIVAVNTSSGEPVLSIPDPDWIFSLAGLLAPELNSFVYYAKSAMRFVDLSTFKPSRSVHIKSQGLQEVFWDGGMSLALGIVMPNEGSCHVASLNLTDGAMSPIVNFSPYLALTGGASVYDPVHHYYYADLSPNNDDYLVRFDLLHAAITMNHSISWGPLQCGQYDPTTDTIFGFGGSGKLLQINTTDASSTVVIDQIPGIPQVGVLDYEARLYYAQLINGEKQPWLVMDIDKKQIVYSGYAKNNYARLFGPTSVGISERRRALV